MTHWDVDLKTVSRLISKTKLSSNGCLEWLNRVDHHGYGKTRRRGVDWGAHRLLWVSLFGPAYLPAHILVCHKCDNRKCLNPDHLFLGSHKENMRDMVLKGRHRWFGRSPDPSSI